MSFIDAMSTIPEPRDIWVVAEVGADGKSTPLTLEIVGGARMMADGLGCYVHAVVMGSELEAAAQELIAVGTDRVHVVEGLDPQHPEVCQVLSDLLAVQPPEILLFGATRLAGNLAPRLAQRFNTGMLPHCISLQMDESERVLIGTHPVFNGEYYEVAACPSARPEIATVEPNTFGPPYLDSYRSGETEKVTVDLSTSESRVRVTGPVDYIPLKAPLRKARRIVSAGRQAGDFECVQQLAGVLGAHVAGAREAMDEGWIGEEQVVGATGETVQPDLYFAIGIRGDTYHAYGIRDAKFVVAIHPEADAPIFKSADAGLVGNPAEVVSALLDALKK
jgi:electron transfer flavoprotein alpha subunit